MGRDINDRHRNHQSRIKDTEHNISALVQILLKLPTKISTIAKHKSISLVKALEENNYVIRWNHLYWKNRDDCILEAPERTVDELFVIKDIFCKDGDYDESKYTAETSTAPQAVKRFKREFVEDF